MIDILNLSFDELTAFVTGPMGESPFRAKQLWEWLWHRRARSFADITVLSKKSRQFLEENAAIVWPATEEVQTSTDGTVKRFNLTRKDPDAAPTLDAGVTLVTGLEDPRTIATDPQNKEIYVADWGKSHQIKVYTPDGKPTRVIGKPGGPQLGPYDDQRMINPQGLAIHPEDNTLWESEVHLHQIFQKYF